MTLIPPHFYQTIGNAPLDQPINLPFHAPFDSFGNTFGSNQPCVYQAERLIPDPLEVNWNDSVLSEDHSFGDMYTNPIELAHGQILDGDHDTFTQRSPTNSYFWQPSTLQPYPEELRMGLMPNATVDDISETAVQPSIPLSEPSSPHWQNMRNLPPADQTFPIRLIEQVYASGDIRDSGSGALNSLPE